MLQLLLYWWIRKYYYLVSYFCRGEWSVRIPAGDVAHMLNMNQLKVNPGIVPYKYCFAVSNPEFPWKQVRKHPSKLIIKTQFLFLLTSKVSKGWTFFLFFFCSFLIFSLYFSQDKVIIINYQRAQELNQNEFLRQRTLIIYWSQEPFECKNLL